jgi:hypothetical protein
MCFSFFLQKKRMTDTSSAIKTLVEKAQTDAAIIRARVLALEAEIEDIDAGALRGVLKECSSLPQRSDRERRFLRRRLDKSQARIKQIKERHADALADLKNATYWEQLTGLIGKAAETAASSGGAVVCTEEEIVDGTRYSILRDLLGPGQVDMRIGQQVKDEFRAFSKKECEIQVSFIAPRLKDVFEDRRMWTCRYWRVSMDAKKTDSGLASKVLKAGAGKVHPKATDMVTVHYSGWTTDGKLFDSSHKRGRPASFPLDGVIKGWTEGVQLMVEGEKRRLWIPAKLAYGENPPPGAPAGTLVFDVELIRIVK